MKNRQLSLILFLFVQLYIYVMLVCFNSNINPKIMFISSSILCFIMGVFLFCKTKDYYIMISALFISLIGDFFFTFFNNSSYIGLICLNITQILYFLRIYLDSDYKKTNLLARIIIIPIILIAFIILKENFNFSVLLWITFITNLFINILFTIKEIGINNFFPIGLLFLFIYGAFIMIYNIENYVTVNLDFINIINNLPFDLRYVFYIPAQVTLTCSIFTVNRRVFSKIKNEDN